MKDMGRSTDSLTVEEIRCPKCGKKLMNLSGQAELPCPRCKVLVFVDTVGRKLIIVKERQKSAN